MEGSLYEAMLQQQSWLNMLSSDNEVEDREPEEEHDSSEGPRGREHGRGHCGGRGHHGRHGRWTGFWRTGLPWLRPACVHAVSNSSILSDVSHLCCVLDI